VLELAGVVTRYGAITMLRDVSLEVAPGRIACLLGPNGSGKTTLIRTILGIVTPVAGEIRFEGQRIDQLRTHRIVERGIGVVPEGRRVFPKMTVEENLRMGAFVEWAPADLAERLDRVFALFPRLAERRQQRAATMSGGEQAMLAMGRALMSRPKLLLLDEPSLGLSPRLTKELFATLRAITRSGQSVLLVEQNVHHSLRLADRVYVLENGRIVRCGTPAELQQDRAIQQAYLGL
jgi:branched-chain amino acid transport system ATP-binding protein